MLPKVLIGAMFAIVIAVCIFDHTLILGLIDSFIKWVKVNPYKSIGYSISILIISVIFALPKQYLVVMLAYTYSQVF